MAGLALLGAITAFAIRGVWPGALDSGDLAVGYAAVSAWIAGENPYDPVAIDEQLAAAGGPRLENGSANNELRNVYFPTTIPMFLPIAFPTWLAGRLVGLAINVAMTAYLAFAVLRILDWRRWAPRAVFLVAFVIALAPLRTAIASGQTSIVATAGILAAVVLQRSGRGTAAGIALGLATAVKVQIGLPFLIYELWRRRWPTVTASTGVLAGLTALSIVRMAVAGVDWLPAWRANLDLLSGPGGMNDPGLQNPQRYSMVNLQYLLESLGFVDPVAEVLTIVAVAGAALLTVSLIRGRYPRQELLTLSIVAVLGLLVTYHRYYDAVILALPIAWAFCAVTTARRVQAVAVIVLCATFIVPIPTNLWDLEQAGRLPAWLVDSAAWQPVILAQQAWALALMIPVMLWAAARDRGAEVAQGGAPRPDALSDRTCAPGDGRPAAAAPSRGPESAEPTLPLRTGTAADAGRFDQSVASAWQDVRPDRIGNPSRRHGRPSTRIRRCPRTTSTSDTPSPSSLRPVTAPTPSTDRSRA